MTKTHFIALADYIKSDLYVFDSHVCESLAVWCKTQNPQFNRERWLSYIAGTCGSNGGAIKPSRKPRYITPERKLARRLEGK